MIILILIDEIDRKTGKKTGREIVSHGYDAQTSKNVVLPNDLPKNIGRYHKELCEWILK